MLHPVCRQTTSFAKLIHFVKSFYPDSKAFLAALYNCLKSFHRTKSVQETEDAIRKGVVLAEIIDYLRDMVESSNDISVFKLSSIKKLFCDRLVAYGATAESVKNVHSTRLKNDILHHIPELEEEKQGNNVLLTPKEETGTAIYQACLENDQDDGICLSKAANIIMKHVFLHKIEDPAQFLASQEASVPPSLVTFISKLISGTCITDSLPTSAHKASLTIAQLVKFNMVSGQIPLMKVRAIAKSKKHRFHFTLG